MHSRDVDTPAVLIDLNVAENNIKSYQKYCNDNGLLLRPHIKTHKLLSMAAAQLEAGAIGLTCQKISEAEAMCALDSVDDIFLTYNVVGHEKLKKLRNLSERVSLSVVADSTDVVKGLGTAFSDAKKALKVFVECDTGAGRCGVQTPAQAAELAQGISEQNGLHFAGLMTYPPIGQAQKVQSWLEEASRLIGLLGLTVEKISSGGSPDMWRAHDVPIASEYRVGTYIYNDLFLESKAACKIDDCALSVLGTVVSMPTSKRAIIDAGSKILTSDLLGLTGHGHVVGHPNIVVDQLSEEHGRLVSDDPLDLKIGDKVQIIPNHACVVSNMVDEVVLVRDGDVVGRETVVARGRMS